MLVCVCVCAHTPQSVRAYVFILHYVCLHVMYIFDPVSHHYACAYLPACGFGVYLHTAAVFVHLKGSFLSFFFFFFERHRKRRSLYCDNNNMQV